MSLHNGKPATASIPPNTAGSAFKREPRYIVFKIKDLHLYCDPMEVARAMVIGEMIAAGRKRHGKPPFNAVVVEQDWHEFEMVWDAIESRMAKEQAKP